MRTLLAFVLFALTFTSAFAQEATPEGDWRDDFGTILRLSLCGDGTQLCGVLIDIQGESRTEANLGFVNRRVMQAEQTGPREWQGAVLFGGSEATSTITQVAADTIEIEGCRFTILCQTLAFQRLEGASPAT